MILLLIPILLFTIHNLNCIPFGDACEVANLAADFIHNKIVERPYRAITERVVDIVWDIAKYFCSFKIDRIVNGGP